MKKVSVIIPVFNSQETLERAVLSVVYEPLVSEIFIVDDGSTDDSREIAQRLAMKFSFIHLLQHPNGENKGGAASRNLGLSYATSEWIQFLDADDELISGKIARQLDMVNSAVAFVVGNSYHVFSDGRKHARKADNGIWKGLIRSKLGDTCSNLWSKKRLEQVGGWDDTLGSSQEYDLMFRLVKNGARVVFDRNYLTLIHKTDDSISTSPLKKELRVRNWLALRERIRNYLIENKKFSLLTQYYWSGAVGVFCIETNTPFHPQINRFLFSLYQNELVLRKIGYNLKSWVNSCSSFKSI